MPRLKDGPMPGLKLGTVPVRLLLLLVSGALGAQIVPSAPRNLKVELVSANEVRLTWEPPQHANGQLRGYYVYKERLENGAPVGGQLQKTSAIMDPKKLYAVIDGLEPNREYAFRVNAFNRNGDGEFSESKSIVTGGMPPKQPEIISVTLIPPDDEPPLRARVEWKAPVLAPLEAPIDRYNIWYRPVGRRDYKLITTATGDATTAVIPGLWMGQQYEILLGAENVEGRSQNATETLVTPVGLPDAEPINVQYEIVQGKMKLSWDAPKEEGRNGNVTVYKAVLTPMDSDGERLEQDVTTNYAIFKVNANRAYTFKVAAATMKGQGPFSPVLTINPDPDGEKKKRGAHYIAAYEQRFTTSNYIK